MDNYKEYEEKMKNNQKENKKYIKEFEEWLKKKNLTLKTIKNHVSNTELYIEDFLNYYDASSMEEGCYRIEDFLGDWYIRKCMWSTAGNLKTTATSIKKFYQCMLELGHIDQEHYDELQSTIKDNMDIWIEEIEEYNDDCFNDLDFLEDLDIF